MDDIREPSLFNYLHNLDEISIRLANLGSKVFRMHIYKTSGYAGFDNMNSYLTKALSDLDAAIEYAVKRK